MYYLDDSRRACDSDKPILSISRMNRGDPLLFMGCVAAPMLLRGYYSPFVNSHSACSTSYYSPFVNLQPAVNCQPSFCRGNSQSSQACQLRNTFTMHAMERQFVDTQHRCKWRECSTNVKHATVVKIARRHDELLQNEQISDEKTARIRQSENLRTQVTEFLF